MRACCAVACLFFVICINLSNGQLPPRLQIPGAVLLGGPPQRPPAFRQGRVLETLGPRPRRPPTFTNAIPIPVREVKPVVEEPEEPNIPNSAFDEEVNKLVLQSAVRDAVSQEEEDGPPPPPPVQFRPQRPVPVLRENIRDTPVPRPPSRPAPILRSEPPPVNRGPLFKQDVPQRFRPQPPPPPPQDDDDLPPVRVRQQVRQQAPVQRAPPKPRPVQYVDDGQRSRKPTVQILRKYRTDNPDGSITWGYENEDGTFKEETLGVDCITRGKYGYVDPDGVKREYNYETGNKCDEPLEEEELLPQGKVIAPQPRKPLSSQPQFRPQGSIQYQQ